MKLHWVIAFVAAAALQATSLWAQGTLHLQWDACYGDSGGVSTAYFDCDPQRQNRRSLRGSFQLGGSMTAVYSFISILDWNFASSDVPDFWRFGSGICNAAALVVSPTRPARCSGSSINICGFISPSCDLYWSFWLPSTSRPNHVKMIIENFKVRECGFTVAGGRRHFLFDIDVNTANASVCPGCGEGGTVTWNLLSIEGCSGFHRVESTSAGSTPTVGINCDQCEAVSARATSWGQLKQLFR